VNISRQHQERFEELVRLGFRDIEIYNRITRIRFKDIEYLKNLARKKRLNLSLHSQVSGFGCSDKIIAEGNFYYLKSEVRLAGLAKFNSVNFHINKNKKINLEDKKRIKELIKFAKKNNIRLTLENNNSGLYSGDYLIEVFQQIKDLNFCLDIGHLSLALNHGLLKDRDKFLGAVRNKVKKLHIHYNNGKVDEHRGLGIRGKKFIREVLDKINKKDLELIIEIWDLREAMDAKNFLKKSL
jgi:sugar phosphate isomerase/epimerase